MYSNRKFRTAPTACAFRCLLAGLAFLFCAVSVQAQTVDWVKLLHGAQTGIGWATASAPDGSSYLSGHFSGTMSIGNQTIASQGLDDGFLIKYDNHGEVVWVKTIGGVYGDNGRDLLIDSQGNIYWSGSFYGQISFLSTNIGVQSESSFFLAKVSPNGQLIWVRSAFGSSGPFEPDMRPFQITANGSVVVGGRAIRSFAFDGHSITVATGENAIFRGVFSPTGNCLQLVKMGSAVFPSAVYLQNVLDGNNGRWYLHGGFRGSVTIDGEPLQAGSDFHAFVLALDQTGSQLWLKLITSGDVGMHVMLDDHEQIWLSGTFKDTLTIDSQELIADGPTDAFIATLNHNGQLRWAKRYGGGGNDLFGYLLHNGLGKMYLVGMATPPAWEHQPLTVLDSVTVQGYSIFGNYGRDLFIAGLDTLGKVEWAMPVGSTNGGEQYGKPALDSYGRLYATGYVGPNAMAGTFPIPSTAPMSAFLLRLSPPGVFVSAEPEVAATQLSVYPNPASGMFQLRLPQPLVAAAQLQLYDAQGRLVHRETATPGATELSVRPPALASGLYLLQLTDGVQSWQSRVAIER